MISYLLLGTLAVVLGSCTAFSQTGKFTVENKSEYDVTGITFTYEHAQQGEKTVTLERLRPGESRDYTVAIAYPQFDGGMEVSHLSIEYYLEGEKYDVQNERDIYKNWKGLGWGRIVFEIERDYYSVFYLDE
jgi:hypothetical protein